MVEESHVIELLLGHGFSRQANLGWKNKNGDRPARFVHPRVRRRGSLYVAPNYVSATGHFKELEKKLAPSDRDHQGNPYWQDNRLDDLLDVIREEYRSQQQQAK